jgi:hypothetical protein
VPARHGTAIGTQNPVLNHELDPRSILAEFNHELDLTNGHYLMQLALGERFCPIIGYLMMFLVPKSYVIEKSRCRVESLVSDNYADPMKLKGKGRSSPE